MMIGGGGDNCGRADHGIGVTEVNESIFNPALGGDSGESDFGMDGNSGATSYGLNLWIR